MARQSPPSLGAILEALPIGVALTLLAALPSFFNFATDQIFEEQKSLLLRAAALMAVPGALALVSGAETRRSLARPIAVLFFAVVVMLAASTLLGGAARDAVFGAYLRRHGLISWLSLAVMFVAMLSAARSAGGRELLVRALVIGAAWPAAYLLMQRAGIDVVQWIAPNEGHQSGSTFGNHVFVGGYLALVIPLTILQSWQSHWTWSALALLQIAGLLASGSRGAVLALCGAGAIAIWRVAPRRVIVGVAQAAGIVLFLLFAVPSLRPAALMNQLDPQVGSARVRILIWGDTIGILRQSGPQLWFGHGPESLRSLFPAHYSPEIGRWEQIDAMPDRAHNETLDMLVSAGVLGAALELALFAVVLLGAIRLPDTRLQAGLAAAVTAHVIELQFGIASTASRLAFLAIAAVIAGAQLPDARESRPLAARNRWLVAAALGGALSPWLSTLPSVINNPITSGTEQQFIEYLARLSLATPMLYAGALVIAIGLARTLADARRSFALWWQLPALAAMAWLVVPTSIVPSRADVFSAAGRSYALDQRWAEAATAFTAAGRAAPSVPDYQEEIARASIEWAVRSAPPRRDQLLQQARAAYERALELDPANPVHSRHLAAYFRIRAAFLEGAAREDALVEADRIYERVSQWAPALTPVWVEWAWVDVDRGRSREALVKLERALQLEPQRGEAQQLRADLLAGRPPVNARRQEMSQQ